ncbi:MAG: amidohydrolase family protein, partial [Planctomycetes bacterium]|nr:amidohydrolase family protein [Planctomycetota bacterium]
MNSKAGYILVGTFIKPVSQTNAVIKDGAIAVGSRTGTIRDCGTLAEVKRKYSTWEEIHLEDSVILPAFADAHTHLPQFSIRRSGKARLYDWLEGIVFPEEMRFKDVNYASQVTYSFFKDMLKNGTLSAMIFMSPFFETISSISQLAEKHSFIDFHAGPILMNTNLPENFDTDTETIIENIEETAVWLKHRFAVSPRYAPLCDAKLFCELGRISAEYNLYIQAHIAELPDEFEKAKQNFPDVKYYSEIYEDTGLLTDKTVLGHCIYLDDEDYKAIAEAKSLVAHLPLANEALGSGRMPLEKLREFGVNWALGTDVGASPTLSMLAVMQSFVRSHKNITQA